MDRIAVPGVVKGGGNLEAAEESAREFWNEGKNEMLMGAEQTRSPDRRTGQAYLDNDGGQLREHATKHVVKLREPDAIFTGTLGEIGKREPSATG